MSDMRAIIDSMTEKQKADFENRFLRVWSDHGFGTLGKRDTELLLFSCLVEAVGEGLSRTNYEWARALLITSARVRNLRRDAYMRFGKLLDDDQGGGIAEEMSPEHFRTAGANRQRQWRRDLHHCR